MNFNLATVFQFLAADLDRFLKDSARPSGYAGIGDPIQLLPDMDFADPAMKNRVSISILKISPPEDGSRICQIMVFAAFKNYETALARISRVQDYFIENQHVVVAKLNGTAIGDAVKSLVFEPLDFSLSELREVWQVRGGRSFPAVFYEMKVELA